MYPPSVVVTVISADPEETAETRPEEETVATLSSELPQVTLFSVASEGSTVASN